MTTKHPTSNATSKAAAGAGPVVGYAGVSAFGGGDLPSFWQALTRYRDRHGLNERQPSQPILDDKDLADLRDTAPARDFSFDTDFAPPSRD